MSNKCIYLDYNSTSPLLPEVQQAIRDNLSTFGNPSALTSDGFFAHQLIDQARTAVANLIHADPSEIYFTSGCTEANNWILRRRTAICSNIEHPSVLINAKPVLRVDTALEARPGVLPPDTLSRYLESHSRPAIISVMYANNEIGTIQPVAELAKVAHRHGALFHSDCTQALGKIPVDVAALGVDIATFSGHKIGAPKGIGCAYIRKGVEIAPLLRGGHQERRLRAGTENTLGIIAFGVAANLARSTPAQYAQDIAPLRDHLRDAITKRLDRIAINGYQTSLLPNTLNISFASAEGESIMLYLDQEGITVGTGSACASADGKPSHVIMALRPDPELAHGSIRFSLGFDTTRADIDRVAAVLPPIIEKLRGISTV